MKASQFATETLIASLPIFFLKKIQSLIAHDYIHHFDIIHLYGTYLNFDISFDNENLDIPRDRLIRPIQILMH